MTWNYRVVLTDEEGEAVCALHEAYYNEGKVEGWTERPCGFVSESVWGLRRQLWRALLDTFRRPPIIDDDPRYTITPLGAAMLEGKK